MAKSQFTAYSQGIVIYTRTNGDRLKIINVGKKGRWWLQRLEGARQYDDLDVTKIIHNHDELAAAIEARILEWPTAPLGISL